MAAITEPVGSVLNSTGLTNPFPSMQTGMLNGQASFSLLGTNHWLTWPLIGGPVSWWQFVLMVLVALMGTGVIAYKVCGDTRGGRVAAPRRVAASKNGNLKFQKRKRLIGRTAI